LVQSFEAVGNANAQARSALLAAGISTAMNATMLGLGVAIPCMIAYSFLMNRTNKLNSELNRSAIRFLDILKQRYFEGEVTVSQSEVGSGHRAYQPAFGSQPVVTGNV
jgi:biopolymer transport protein ExbB/TolQ